MHTMTWPQLGPFNALLLVLFVVAVVAALALSPAGAELAPLKVRTFEFTYATTVRVPADGGHQLDLWLPVPQSGPGQTVTDLAIEAPFPWKIEKESEYGNAVLHGTFAAPAAPVTVTLKAKVARTEVRADLAAIAARPEALEDVAPFARFLAPDRLGIINDDIRARAHDVTRERKSTLEKARAIYDHVLATMTYSKEGIGWGQGDVVYACTEKKGNCSDFHSLFISLARAAGIPARFEIGFPLPTDKTEGTLGGYHCWAQFHVPGAGWVPVDCSEARKHPELREYYFGCLCQNRVLFTVGRDLSLTPKQQSGPVNFLIYPLVEVDGKACDGIDKTFSFKDLAGPAR